jgi:hypothetical protein
MTIRKTSKPFIGGATLKRDRVGLTLTGRSLVCRNEFDEYLFSRCESAPEMCFSGERTDSP